MGLSRPVMGLLCLYLGMCMDGLRKSMIHGHFREHWRCRGQDQNEAITEAKTMTYFHEPIYLEEV
jgi:hypothetical protein